tara:strand:- start:31 stop:660 length:630 start_codon:yes stop_codon:yes gene_type:complete
MEKLPYKKVCQRCSADFRSKGPNNKYCSKECKKQTYFENSKLYTCKVCNTKFQGVTNNFNIYCSKKCYGIDMSNNPQNFNLNNRASKMRESWDENSWKKSIETRKSNGNIIDWNVAEWKQYWRRCNDLTQKIRREMLGEWDGIDYIDGEQIRHYMKLPHYHGDYPTLDHVIPRSEGFKRGLSPYEITTKENLKWTKRRNNSKKYNSYGR